MRTIKFRMWDTENKEVIDGDSLAFEEYAPLVDLLNQEGIMQYTGLRDKNGTEIYEEDILRVYLNGTRGSVLVRWNDHFKGWRLYEDEKPLGKHMSFNDVDQVEVIGNIYEHPHLLKKEAQHG